MKNISYDRLFEVNREKYLSKGIFAMSHPAQIIGDEGIHWLSLDKLDALINNNKKFDFDYDKSITYLEDEEINGISNNIAPCFNSAWGTKKEAIERLKALKTNQKKRVNLLAVGDVGGMVLTGLRLLGENVISRLGIFDLSKDVMQRYEYELNQVAWPMEYDKLPEIELLKEEQLFDCDVFVFCAAKNVPQVGASGIDMRMVQLEENSKIVKAFAKKAADANYKGIFAVVSDPVDQLCKAAFDGGEGKLWPDQIKGFGLGVMNARAAYYAKKDSRFKSFLSEGRAFGPHGADLVIANSIENYNHDLSVELTELAVKANLEVRKTGFKPYIAPSLSSAAISLVLMMEGKWHYSSSFLAGVWIGSYNRMTHYGIQIEHLKLPEDLYYRIKNAYNNLLNY